VQVSDTVHSRRVFAAHLTPGQLAPNRVLNPDSINVGRLVLVSIETFPFMGLHVEPNYGDRPAGNSLCIMPGCNFFATGDRLYSDDVLFLFSQDILAENQGEL